MLRITLNRWAILMLSISIIVSLRNFGFNFSYSASSFNDSFLFFNGINQVHQELFLEQDIPPLQYDYYRDTCPLAETTVRSAMKDIFDQHKDAPPALLRLLFHDCFIGGCDASVFLDDSHGNKNHSIERQAIPNKTLKGFDKIDIIKEELEKVCPGVVSCADVLALATRDGIVLAGGPFYPVFTGRKDSTGSFFTQAMEDIPKPDGNISETLRLFGVRGFTERDIVSLLGAHNIGKISCEFIRNRLYNFMGTGQPDPTISSDFLYELRQRCQDSNSTNSTVNVGSPTPIPSRVIRESVLEMINSQNLVRSIPSGVGFGSHYFQRLVRGRGFLFSDQQLMADENTARLVRAYASDNGSMFRVDFARAMVKMSSLDVLSGSQGQVRINCSLPVVSS